MPKCPRPRVFRVFLAALAFGAAAPAAAEPAAAPSGAETAEAIAKRCRSPLSDKERECYSAAMDARLAEGPAPALALLGELAAIDEDVRRDGHMHAHRIGIGALKSPADVGKVFASCTPAWQSGCYHGVIQSYFLASQRAGSGITAENVNALCGDYRGFRADLLFQCTHGLGHGLTMLHGHDLPQALKSCDLLSLPAEQEMCHAGAFMENIVNATHPHGAKTASAGKETGHGGHGGHAGHGGHGGHGAHGGHGQAAVAAKPFRALDPDDLHYPCSVAGEKYLIACYTIQTSAMLHHARQDVRRVAAECGRAPERARATCFLSLGRDVSTIALGKPAEAVRLCGLAQASFRPACHRGVVESLVNMNADPSEGIPYCKAVPEEPSKRVCYAAVGLQAMVLPNGSALREKACQAAEPNMADACLGRPVTPAPAAAGTD
jgi:hypothetical protein